MVSSLVCDRIQIEVALFKPGSLLNRIKNISVLDGMQSNNHHRLHRHAGPHQCRDLNESRRPKSQSSVSTNGQCWPPVPFGPLVCLWNTQEGKKVTACRDARMTGKALGNVSPVCKRTLPPGGCRPSWELDRKGRGSDNRLSVR